MRPYHLAVAFILATAVSAAPVPKAVKKQDDKSTLVGTWKVSAVTINGNDSFPNTHTFIFDADGGVKTLFGKISSTSTWNWTIDTTTSPRTMRWESNPKNNNNNSLNCVYELDDDSLKVGFISPGSKPPAKLEPTEGLTLYVMIRDTSTK